MIQNKNQLMLTTVISVIGLMIIKSFWIQIRLFYLKAMYNIFYRIPDWYLVFFAIFFLGILGFLLSEYKKNNNDIVRFSHITPMDEQQFINKKESSTKIYLEEL